jgi:ABC-2 type transport system ATP-binding protein
MVPALEADALSIVRGGQPALRAVSFTVRPGEVHALLGGNGAGKSTTLLAFLGFLAPSGGAARVEGVDVTADLARARRRIAYLPENAALYAHLDAYENLGYFLALAGLRPGRAAIDAALDRVALGPAARRRRLESYSKGMRQKVAIALALLRETPILLLDEPTSGLDPVAIDEFNRLLRELSGGGRTVLMVTHDVYGACQVADRIGLLRDGALVGRFESTPDARIDTAAVHAAFVDRDAA